MSEATLADRLSDACVGSCSCAIKSPAIEHHLPDCHYRLFFEAHREVLKLERLEIIEKYQNLCTVLNEQTAEISALKAEREAALGDEYEKLQSRLDKISELIGHVAGHDIGDDKNLEEARLLLVERRTPDFECETCCRIFSTSEDLNSHSCE